MASPQPIPGVKINPPLIPPQPGQVITHYETYQPQAGCCKCEGMKQSGLIAIILLVIFFWPLAFIPCVMEDCFETQQRPVYGYANGQESGYGPGQGPGHGPGQGSIPTAEPVKGEPVPTYAKEPPV